MATLMYLKRAVTRLIAAEVDHANRGVTHVRENTANELHKARASYNRQCEIIQRHLDAGGDKPDLRGL